METERKFLVRGEAWRALGTPVHYEQGYLSRGDGVTVRIRMAGEEARLTVKGPVSGISREEYEYPVPAEDARSMIRLCRGAVIEKTRTRIPLGNRVWEVDEFLGKNAGLIVAEIELNDPDETVELPPWIAREVTGDPRYYNSNLTSHPYGEWKREDDDHS